MIFDFLKSVTSKLNELQLPYMLTGSAAIDFYTVGRSTKDLDFVVELKEQDVEQLILVFKNHYFHKPSIISEIKKKGMFNLIDFETGFKIDFFIRKETVYASTAFNRRQLHHEVFEEGIWVISLEDLIIAKLQWIQDLQSDRQIDDIKKLMLNPKIDIPYLKHWITTLKLNTYNLAL